MPGEELADALAAASELEREGCTSVVTALGENVADEAAARAVARHYEQALAQIVAQDLDCELSVKPTHLGLDLSKELAQQALTTLAARSAAAGRTLWIDMESSAYTDATLELYRTLLERTERLGVCLQANLRRTAADLAALRPLGATVRLVKGAYLEPASVAFTRKSEVDTSYAGLAAQLLDDGWRRVAIATHDPRLIATLRERVRGHASAEFQMLYGIRRETQRSLLRAGVPLRVLISYGPEWFPWYMRRLAERPANVLFLLRSLVAR